MMPSDSPKLPDIPEPYLQAVAALSKNTTYLWKAFVSLKADKNEFVCQIRQSTYQRIQGELNTLSEAGFFEFNILYGLSGQEKSVIKLEITRISNPFKEMIRLFDVKQDVSHSPVANERPPSAKVTPLLQSSSHPLAKSLKWYFIAGVLILIGGWYQIQELSAPAPVVVQQQPMDSSPKPVIQTPVSTPPIQLHIPKGFTHAVMKFSDQGDRGPDESEPSLIMTQNVVVDMERASLYATPSFHGLLLKELTQGQLLRVLWEKNGWLQVTDSANMSGWVATYATRDVATGRRITLSDHLSAVNPSP
ncbi:MAG: hypothetical protein HQL93_02090 [Magnetococcales bacterium]|nr:hypothetical protein [Magnetococcales bacterium]